MGASRDRSNKEKNKEVKMTRRYLHPANGRRNAGVDEQILLYSVAQFILNSLYSPFRSQESRKMVAFGFLSDLQIIPLNRMNLFVRVFPVFLNFLLPIADLLEKKRR